MNKFHNNDSLPDNSKALCIKFTYMAKISNPPLKIYIVNQQRSPPRYHPSTWAVDFHQLSRSCSSQTHAALVIHRFQTTMIFIKAHQEWRKILVEICK